MRHYWQDNWHIKQEIESVFWFKPIVNFIQSTLSVVCVCVWYKQSYAVHFLALITQNKE